MSAHIAGRVAHLVLIEKSGAKHRIPQPSAGAAMAEAEHAMHRSSQLREVKVIVRHQAVARWKSGEQGWRRVGVARAASTEGHSQSRRRKTR